MVSPGSSVKTTRLRMWESPSHRHGRRWRNVTTMRLSGPGAIRLPLSNDTGTPAHRGPDIVVSRLKYVSVSESAATPSMSR